ncbi:MAG TPA: antibiotic biosynthesis monooxygenase family protein [Cyclobacteriaceae bacterium]|nr:antibiotic biosynthesis monooxygenase family protein [Cyclobacteriaceae bacterium]
MRRKNIQFYFIPGFTFVILTAVVLLFGPQASAQQNENIVRIAEIEIFPEYVTEYRAILKEEAEASVRLEAGVLAIFPMYLRQDSTQIRILEIYDSQDAYQSHLRTPHFQKYKTTTQKMVKSLNLVDMNTIIDPESMKMIFSKVRK